MELERGQCFCCNTNKVLVHKHQQICKKLFTQLFGEETLESKDNKEKLMILRWCPICFQKMLMLLKFNGLEKLDHPAEEGHCFVCKNDEDLVNVENWPYFCKVIEQLVPFQENKVVVCLCCMYFLDMRQTIKDKVYLRYPQMKEEKKRKTPNTPISPAKHRKGKSRKLSSPIVISDDEMPIQSLQNKSSIFKKLKPLKYDEYLANLEIINNDPKFLEQIPYTNLQILNSNILEKQKKIQKDTNESRKGIFFKIRIKSHNRGYSIVKPHHKKGVKSSGKPKKTVTFYCEEEQLNRHNINNKLIVSLTKIETDTFIKKDMDSNFELKAQNNDTKSEENDLEVPKSTTEDSSEGQVLSDKEEKEKKEQEKQEPDEIDDKENEEESRTNIIQETEEEQVQETSEVKSTKKNRGPLRKRRQSEYRENPEIEEEESKDKSDREHLRKRRQSDKRENPEIEEEAEENTEKTSERGPLRKRRQSDYIENPEIEEEEGENKEEKSESDEKSESAEVGEDVSIDKDEKNEEDEPNSEIGSEQVDKNEENIEKESESEKSLEDSGEAVANETASDDNDKTEIEIVEQKLSEDSVDDDKESQNIEKGEKNEDEENAQNEEKEDNDEEKKAEKEELEKEVEKETSKEEEKETYEEEENATREKEKDEEVESKSKENSQNCKDEDRFDLTNISDDDETEDADTATNGLSSKAEKNGNDHSPNHTETSILTNKRKCEDGTFESVSTPDKKKKRVTFSEVVENTFIE